MGLREEIQADIAEAFNDDLADAVHSFTCDRISRKDWDPKTETYVEVKRKLFWSWRSVWLIQSI